MATSGVEVLDERRRGQVRQERALLEELRVLLAGFDAAPDDLQTLRDAAATLDEMFLLVVVGEFNAGKSAVINALVGETVAEEGITPTTTTVTVLRHGETRGARATAAHVVEKTHPAPFLRTISIVDTPGTNAIIRRHEEITERFAPRADLVLFVTSADRPFTESERAFMARLRGWGENVAGRYAEASAGRAALLAEDRKAEDNIERQIAVFREDMERDFRARPLAIDNVVYEMNERATRFFEATMRLSRVPDLLNSGRIRAEFDREVVADSAQRIDDGVRDLVDWAVDAQLRLWQGVTDYLARRRRAASDEGMLGAVTGSSFTQDRRAVLENAVRSARRVVERYDREEEAQQLATSMRDSVAYTGLAAAGGVGLGAVVVAITSAAALDVTGVLAGLVIVGLGLYIIPARRRRAQQRFSQESEELRQHLDAALTEQFSRQLDGALENLRAALAPYVRFVRAEHERVTRFRDDLSTLQGRIRALRHAIEG